jgi:hypothetical protein
MISLCTIYRRIKGNTCKHVSHKLYLSFLVLSLGSQQHTFCDFVGRRAATQLSVEEPVLTRLLSFGEFIVDSSRGCGNNGADTLLFARAQATSANFRTCCPQAMRHKSSGGSAKSSTHRSTEQESRYRSKGCPGYIGTGIDGAPERL